MRLLLFGGSGQVGQELLTLASAANDVQVVAPSRTELDLLDTDGIAKILGAQTWTAIINAAAYTDVDGAESHSAEAFEVNAEGPAHLASETSRYSIPIIHISSDYIFDGRKGSPYFEKDQPAPVNLYGRSKLFGEQAVRDANPRHVILRTSWVYSPIGKNFMRTILRLAAERDELRIVSDQRGCPTAAREVAKACLDIAATYASEADDTPYGTYHFAGAGDATWFDFATEIVRLAHDRLGRSPQLIPISTGEYRTAANRPADTRLNCAAIKRAYGIDPRPWEDVLVETISRIAEVKTP